MFISIKKSLYSFIISYKKAPAEDLEKLVIDENLDSYFMCLTGIDQKRWYTKELYLRKKLDIKSINDDAFAKLQTE